MEKIRVGVVGATGYAGSEICRLIMGHPQAELAAISSVSFEGMALSQVYPAYNQMIDLVCGTQDQVVEQSDVVFAALPHGLSQDLAAQCDALGKTFIDMGADFRLEDEAAYQEWYGGAYQDKALHEKAVYGLPEFFREKIRGKKVIANPGCYTTAVPLALVPALEAGLIESDGIIADCKSGVTGAGRKPTQGNHYPELNESFTAYKVAAHRHTPEIEQTLSKMVGSPLKVTFRAPPAAHQPGHSGHLLRQAEARRHRGPAVGGLPRPLRRGVLRPPAGKGPGGQREERALQQLLRRVPVCGQPHRHLHRHLRH